ncbi:hypothetical protein AAFF_G00248830 [Aldrovandia affinis]|uniref:Uncharacterized protein n=1 Tax=Aldrovandia affinis TaxID=143900 RepID=A0AAD7RD30_9TELE|nr:hypothetical protein AAFF_G00248830 [Aldrovandia affinis]
MKRGRMVCGASSGPGPEETERAPARRMEGLAVPHGPLRAKLGWPRSGIKPRGTSPPDWTQERCSCTPAPRGPPGPPHPGTPTHCALRLTFHCP